MIVKNNKYQKEWHNATKPLIIISQTLGLTSDIFF
jgi:hypothetical protein